MINLRYLVENDLFIVCPLLAMDNFVSYCKERGLDVSSEKLEELERMQLFYPIARIRRPIIKIKIEYVNNGTAYKDLGILKRGEEWSGDIKEEYSSFRFEKNFALSWLEEGLLWEPSSRPFESWKTFYGGPGKKHTENFYSIFQCWHLEQVLRMTTVNVSLGRFLSVDENTEEKLVSNLTDVANMVIPSLRNHRAADEAIILLCQALSNRYFPHTQSDRRMINVTTSDIFIQNWDWHEYRCAWNASKVLTDAGLEPDKLKNHQELVAHGAQRMDPLERWYDLVSFISLQEKKKLKGSALLAQLFYTMSEMLRLLYEEITGKKLPAPGDSLFFNKGEFYGAGVIDHELRFLEMLTNQYHLNPKPKLILVVEGFGEEEQIPRIAEQSFGVSFPRVGIEVVNLAGIDNFAGKKDLDKYGALEKFIDYYHSRQTYVFVVLDNEGRASKVRNELLKARSKFYPKRKATKANAVRLWGTCIEFDNFSHEEIAQAMTELSEGRYLFTAQEIAACETALKAKKGDPLRELFSAKVDYTLSKPKLLASLVDFILASPEKEKDENGELKRPLLRLVWEVIDLAAKNHQPVSMDVWKKNQESGHFGDILP